MEISYILSNPLLTYAYLICSFALLGALLKYIDDAFDGRAFSRDKAIVLAPLAGILWAFSMALSAPAATILAAIVISALVAGKIDNAALWLGFACIAMLLLLYGGVDFMWVPLVVIALAGIADEIGNGWADSGRIKNRAINYFFTYRCAMKVAVFSLAALAVFGWIYFFAFLGFDIAYMLVSAYGRP